MIGKKRFRKKREIWREVQTGKRGPRSAPPPVLGPKR